jgi:hypothetical protein
MKAGQVSHNDIEKWIKQIVEDKGVALKILDPSVTEEQVELFKAGVNFGAHSIVSTFAYQGIIERTY